MENALGENAPTEASWDEQEVFRKVLKKARVKSRSKGRPSVVDLNALDEPMRTGVSGKQQMMAGHLAPLGQIATYTAADIPPRAHFSQGVRLLRSAHTNRAGWLVQTPTPALTQLDQAARAWARTTITAGGAPAAALSAAFGPTATTATALGIEELTTLPLATKQNYYTTVHGPQMGGAAQLIRHASRRYADATFPNCVHIEISAESCGGLSRIVWDFMADRYYLGVHYQWVEGYSPFFEVAGLPATY